ncbi:ESX secretion-associated protein EspG [Nocardia sp. CDC160]|uniref:ESX secretion-associated protein EspG n=1 Tax=Nocardia sp. CDC160 TaxID=3112166 RepID=UPI002DB83AF7|nr:ESX secretion-associated protein EspG [Nocardia sp. CDC160]MEC3919270.1 ESX secretion-associated protein EspG [Nocardia sp. CDC160]
MLIDELLVVAELLGVQTLPSVLRVRPGHDSAAAWTALRASAMRSLRSAGLLDAYADVDCELADALRTLEHPERELAMHIYTESGNRQACLVRHGAQHALAVRNGDAVEIAGIWADDGAALASPVIAVIGSGAPADTVPLRGLTCDILDCLDTAREPSDYIRLLARFGMSETDALEFGIAMSHCVTRVEIVAYDHVSGGRSSGAAVYDTHRGRIVAVPTTAADGQCWTTLLPGSDHNVAGAISGLVRAMPSHRWMA